MLSLLLVIVIISFLIAFVTFLREYDALQRRLDTQFYLPSRPDVRLIDGHLCSTCILASPRGPQRHFTDLSLPPPPPRTLIAPLIASTPICNEFNYVPRYRPPPSCDFPIYRYYIISGSRSAGIMGPPIMNLTQTLTGTTTTVMPQLLPAPSPQQTMSFIITPSYAPRLTGFSSSPLLNRANFPRSSICPRPTAGNCSIFSSGGNNFDYPLSSPPTAGQCSILPSSGKLPETLGTPSTSTQENSPFQSPPLRLFTPWPLPPE